MKSNTKYILAWLFFSWAFIGFSQDILFTEQEKEWISKHPVIEFGYDKRWEPYEFFSNGQYGGIVEDYVKIIEEKTGIEMRPLSNMTWEKSMKGLIDGSVMVIPSCISTPERKKLFEFSEPYIIDPIVIVARRDAPYFSTLEDLKDKNISLSNNYYTIELIEDQFPDIHIKEYETIEKCLRALTRGETDAFVGNLNVITYYINHYGFNNLKIVGTTPFKDNGVSFAFNPEWKTLKDIVNKVILQISPEKQHEIRKKWIEVDNGRIFSVLFLIWSSIIFLIVLISLAIVYYWNRVLKQKLKSKRETEHRLKSLLIEVKKSDEEKKILLQEIHHRVKNNLQIVSSMLNLQANANHDEKTRQALKEAMDRVASVALVHKKMYQSPSIDTVNLKNYTESLFNDICSQYPNCDKVELSISTVEINSTMDSIIPLALILNELITNSLKYALQSQDILKITIDYFPEKLNKLLQMKYADNGTWIKNEESDSFGTSMIEIFTEQIDGSFELNKEKGSTTYQFKFSGIEIK